ncbi:MAG: hypothetical protein ACI9S8_002280 [Chlamydiales bacterium]|jgi:hypothetical protein
MSSLTFPPHNPQAYDVAPHIFLQGLDLEVDDMTGGAPMNRRGKGSGEYHDLWKHLLRSYWTEIYDQTTLKTVEGLKLDPNTDVSPGNALHGVREIWEKLLKGFEGNDPKITDATNSFLTKHFGGSADNFYDDKYFSKTDRVKIFESYLRTQEIGRKRYNIFLWVWDFLLQVMQKIQVGALNKTLAQRWMNQAQKNAVEGMTGISKEFVKQKSGEDYNTIHLNQVLNQRLDIIRGEKGAVTRASSIKSQEAGAYLQKYSETNTFLKSMIDQLESALRATMK